MVFLLGVVAGSLLFGVMPMIAFEKHSEKGMVHAKSYTQPSAITTAELNICQAVLLKQAFYCAGPAYDTFTQQLMKYARTIAGYSSTLGRREFPLPDNTNVFVIGNSHTAQVFIALMCQYKSLILRQEEHPKRLGYPQGGPGPWTYFSRIILR
jgi:hypothetical protein